MLEDVTASPRRETMTIWLKRLMASFYIEPPRGGTAGCRIDTPIVTLGLVPSIHVLGRLRA
jgi:hypothetical protein